MTLGDALDRAFGGVEHYVSWHCTEERHKVCMGLYGGRTCECECHQEVMNRHLAAVPGLIVYIAVVTIVVLVVGQIIWWLGS